MTISGYINTFELDDNSRLTVNVSLYY